MQGITTVQMLLDGATMPSISALSPSGRHLAYAVEQTIADTTTVEWDQHQDRPQQQPRPEGGTDDDGPTPPSLPDYQVAIASCHAANMSPISPVAAVGQTSEERPMPSSELLLSSQAAHVNKCTLKAPVTALQWLDESHLACGLQDGSVTIIIAGRRCRSESAAQQQRHHNNGDRLLEHDLGREQGGGGGDWTPALSRCFHRAKHGGGAEDKSRRVVRIRLSGGGVAGGEGAAAGGATRSSEPTVWVLYPDRVLVCVGVEAIVTLAR